MNAPTPSRPVAAVTRSGLAETRVKESTLRRVGNISAAVVLIAAGVMIGMYGQPDIAATLIAAGVHVGVVAMTEGHDKRRHPRRGDLALGC